MSYRTPILLLMTLGGHAAVASAQSLAIASDLLFYGDNTEFTNPFRSGETILGASGRVLLDVTLNDTVKLRAGIFGLGRFGAHEFLEQVEPAIALELSRGGSRFVFGSLDTVAWQHDVAGPDLETPHRLLPPIQQETLTFTRGQEMGLQWLVHTASYSHDAWINWQRLNTADHRERFDAGYRSALDLTARLQLHGQWHVVHEGGQQFGNGPVSDSQAGSVGVQWKASARGNEVTLDAHGVATRDVPDRDDPRLTEAGLGVFARGALRRGPWRTHLIVWRSRDTLKAEGDANYLAWQTSGTMFHNVRDYAELGVTRHFQPAPDVPLYAAFRLHRIESHYEYSFRLVGRVRLRRAL